VYLRPISVPAVYVVVWTSQLRSEPHSSEGGLKRKSKGAVRCAEPPDLPRLGSLASKAVGH